MSFILGYTSARDPFPIPLLSMEKASCHDFEIVLTIALYGRPFCFSCNLTYRVLPYSMIFNYIAHVALEGRVTLAKMADATPHISSTHQENTCYNCIVTVAIQKEGRM